MAALLLVPVVLQVARADDVTAQSDIEKTCGLSLGSSTISFANSGNSDPSKLNRGQESDEEDLTLENQGSTTADIDVSGTDWTGDDDGIVHITVGNTKYAVGDDSDADPTGDFTYAQKTALPSSDTFMGVLVPDVTNHTAWQLKAVLQNLPFNGALSQTITFTADCSS